MAKNRTNGMARPPLFKKGDIVSFPYFDGSVTGIIVEDRGCLGIGGRRLYGLQIEMNPGDPRYTEMPEEELNAGPGDP